MVFVFLKTSLFEVVLNHYIRPVGKNQQQIYHDGYTTSYIPYYISSKVIGGDASQVTNDLYIWESKSFAKRTYLD